jgi:clan AA aspartic protease (TIGR02281 family)
MNRVFELNLVGCCFKKTNRVLGVFWFAAIFFGYISDFARFPVANAQPTPIPGSNLGQELVQQVRSCVQSKFTNSTPKKTDQKPEISTLAMQCTYEVVILNKDGSVRADASERINAMFVATGAKVPLPVSQGTSSNIKMGYLPQSRVFTVPVTIAGKTKGFLLDTGASSSIINSQTAKQLQLPGNPIPGDVLKYMGVGNNCTKVQASLHKLPAINVNSASVSGLSGLGLSPNSIPGKTAGVLGLDFLSQFDMVVNPKQQQLKLLSPSKLTTSGIPLQGKLGAMTVEVKVNGKGPFRFMLDTGADVMVLSQPLAKQLGINNLKAKKTDVQGFCGFDQAREVKLNQFSIQQYQASQLDAVVLENDGLFNMLGIQGIIGQNFLNKYQQHWRFGERSPLGFPNSGSLVLTPIK